MTGERERERISEDRMQMIFLIAFVLYASATILQTTMYMKYEAVAIVLPYVRYLAFGMAGLLVLFTAVCDIRGSFRAEGKERLQCWRYTALFVLCAAVSAVVSLRTGDRTTLFVTVFLFAVRRRYLDRLLRTAFAVQGAMVVFVIGSSMLGIIPDLLIKRDVIPIRHSLGFTYPSVCTSYLFSLLLLYLWIYGSKLMARELAWLLILNCLFYILTDARIFFVLVNLVLISAYVFCVRGMDRRWSHKLLRLQRFQRPSYRVYAAVYDYLPVILAAVFAVLCLIDQLAGGNSILDRMLSGRLKYTSAAVKDYGIHLIAGKIRWIGFGGAENTDVLLSAYNFVDCSYAYILIGYGILMFVLVMAYLVLLQKYVRQRTGLWKAGLLAVMWCYCLLEPRMLELQVNCFFLLGAPVLRMAGKHKGGMI